MGRRASVPGEERAKLGLCLDVEGITPCWGADSARCSSIVDTLDRVPLWAEQSGCTPAAHGAAQHTCAAFGPDILPFEPILLFLSGSFSSSIHI